MKFDAFGTSKHGEGKSLSKIFFATLHVSAHWGDLIEQIKKICHIHFNIMIIMHRKLLKSEDSEEILIQVHRG